ncbi:MAG: helix-hairpin-helix domain-containing protein [Acidimicrobiales bacterium]
MAHRSIPPPLAEGPADDPLAAGALATLGRRLLRSDGLAPLGRPPARPLLLAIVGAVVLLVAGWWFLRPASVPIESTMPVAGAADQGAASTLAEAAPLGSTSTTTTAEVVVQAAGAVRSPGLYRLAPGARVDDLVRAAGGLAEDADPDRINLASPVADGERVWIPPLGVDEVPDVVAGRGGSGSVPEVASGTGDPAAGEPASELIDLNVADAAALDSLPGVGPATASAIIAYRESSGPFASVDDLLEVRGIGDAKLEQLRPLVTVR